MDPVKTASDVLGNGLRPVGRGRNSRQKPEVTSPVGNEDLGMTLSLTPTGNNDFDMIYIKNISSVFGAKVFIHGASATKTLRKTEEAGKPESTAHGPWPPATLGFAPGDTAGG